MNILSIFLKNKLIDTTVRDRIINNFNFLNENWGFVIIESYSPYNNSSKDVVIYQNKENNLQIDISANRDTEKQNHLNIEVTKLLYGYADYSDIDNYFSFTTLLKLDNEEQNTEYFGWHISQDELLRKAANLLIKHKDFFTSNSWKSLDLYEQLNEYAKKNNLYYNSNWKPFVFPHYKSFRFLLNELMTKKGYTLSCDSRALPSYANDSRNDKFEYSKSKRIISIVQHDIRDDSDSYTVYLGNKPKITFRLIGDKTANLAIKEIEKILK